MHCLSIARFVPVLRLALQSNHNYSAHWRWGRFVCVSSMRMAPCFIKTERELARARTSIVTELLRNNMTSNKCAKNVLVLYMAMHGAWRLFLKVGFMYIFSRKNTGKCISFGRVSENLRWPSRDEMVGCLHGKLYAFSQLSTRSK